MHRSLNRLFILDTRPKEDEGKHCDGSAYAGRFLAAIQHRAGDAVS